MSVKANCTCGQRFRAAKRLIGRPVRCPKCREKFLLKGDRLIRDDSSDDNSAQTSAVPQDMQEPPTLLKSLDDLVPITTANDRDAVHDHLVPELIPEIAETAPSKKKADWEANPRSSSSRRLIFILAIPLTVLGSLCCGTGVFFSGMTPFYDGPLTKVVSDTIGNASDSLLGRSKNSIDLSYLPSDIFMLEYMRIADSLETPAGNHLIESMPPVLAVVQFAELATGVSREEIDTVTVGYRDPSSVRDLPGGFTLETTGILAFTGVVRTNEPIDQDRVIAFAGDAERFTHAGVDYVIVERRTRFPVIYQMGLFFPDDKTIVFGTINELKDAMESNGRSSRQDAFDLIEPDDHFAWITDYRDQAGIIDAQLAKLGTEMETRHVFDCGSDQAARLQQASTDFVQASAQSMFPLFDQMADQTLPFQLPEDFREESDAMVDEFAVRFERDGQLLIRRQQLKNRNEYARSFPMRIIIDVLPLPGSDEFQYRTSQ